MVRSTGIRVALVCPLFTPPPPPPSPFRQAESEDVKPAQQTITIKIKEGEKPSVTFKVKRGIPFQKIFDAFHNKVGAAAGTYKFMRDGTRLEAQETPDALDMEDDEQIDAIAQQVRAPCLPSPPPPHTPSLSHFLEDVYLRFPSSLLFTQTGGWLARTS
jgi:small ubiquitin-related modifier